MQENFKSRYTIDRRSGQSAIEFALILPVLLLLILGAIDLGRMFYTKIVLTNAAREGANYLAYFPDNPLVDTDGDNVVDTPGALVAIKAEGLSSNVVIDAVDVTYIDCCTPGLRVGVSVTKTVDLVFDGVLQSIGLISGPVQLTSIVWMVVQS